MAKPDMASVGSATAGQGFVEYVIIVLVVGAIVLFLAFRSGKEAQSGGSNPVAASSDPGGTPSDRESVPGGKAR